MGSKLVVISSGQNLLLSITIFIYLPSTAIIVKQAAKVLLKISRLKICSLLLLYGFNITRFIATKCTKVHGKTLSENRAVASGSTRKQGDGRFLSWLVFNMVYIVAVCSVWYKQRNQSQLLQ